MADFKWNKSAPNYTLCNKYVVQSRRIISIKEASLEVGRRGKGTYFWLC